MSLAQLIKGADATLHTLSSLRDQESEIVEQPYALLDPDGEKSHE